MVLVPTLIVLTLTETFQMKVNDERRTFFKCRFAIISLRSHHYIVEQRATSMELKLRI